MSKFPEYKNFSLKQTADEMLAQWEKEQLFEQSVKTHKGAQQFLFFEGPPSANGMPGIPHVRARSIKDTFCRYKTMQGFQVQRKAGWDTHGLPVELGVEKMLGITKEDIGKKISVDEYNAACRREVMKYTKEWTNLTKQMGYWVDLDNPYITYDNKYIETLWYLLKQLYKKGFLYKGYTIQPYSPMAGTGLSSHELNQPGCYRDVKDTTCTAQFRLTDTAKLGFTDNLPVFILAWTTTPWTLPSNTALCVGPKIDYVAVSGENLYTHEKAIYILAEARLNAYTKELGEQPEILVRYKGADLVGLKYEQLFAWVDPVEYQKETDTIINRKDDAFRVIAGDYVTTDDGTGIVHIAPTFGADDKRVAEQAGIPALYMITRQGELRPMVDLTGKYFNTSDLNEQFVKENIKPDYEKWQGQFVKNAYDKEHFWTNGRYDEQLALKSENIDIRLCIDMKASGKVFKIEKHEHSYPHCWRTDTPIVYYPLDSWFIRSTSARDEMISLNQTIHWQPESTGTGRFGKWLENLNDWNLSRSRYWGTPLPIWRTKDGQEEKCIGSIKELFVEIDKAVAAGLMKENPWKNHKPGDYSKENYDPKVIDLHRPYVDQIVLVSQSGQPMYRELDLIDVWFDSGAMPYAQVHYPFENQNAPLTADFISEGVDQTRGWFFTLHAIHTMIDNSVAYRNVISTGLVLDKNGLKMSKRLGNAIDPFEMLNTYGADAVRWYMLTNSSPWDNLKFDKDGVLEVSRKFFGTLYNTYSFFALYANVDGWTKEQETQINDLQEIDRWILSKLNSLISEVTASYEDYDPTRAGRAISDFVQDELSNWYVRLNRKRFWTSGLTDDKKAAYSTLYKCLKTVSQLMAPIAPFYADRLYRDLKKQETKTDQVSTNSVHLASFPKADEQMQDAYLEGCMNLAQRITSLVLALRRKADKKVKQPLQKAIVPVNDSQTARQLEHIAAIICQEVNIKELVISNNDDMSVALVHRIKPKFQVLGKKYGKQMKEIAAQLGKLSQQDIALLDKEGQINLSLTDSQVVIERDDVDILTEDMPGWLVVSEGSLTVALDIEVTPELEKEGTARELVNRLQNLRKEMGLEITDKISVTIGHDTVIEDALKDFGGYVATQVLATSIRFEEIAQPTANIELNDTQLPVKIEKA